jgi:hypothetical protein
MKQTTFSMIGYFDKGKRTKREQLLAEMDQVMPWVRLHALIEPHYPKASKVGGRPPIHWSACCASTAWSSGTPVHGEMNRPGIPRDSVS